MQGRYLKFHLCIPTRTPSLAYNYGFGGLCHMPVTCYTYPTLSSLILACSARVHLPTRGTCCLVVIIYHVCYLTTKANPACNQVFELNQEASPLNLPWVRFLGKRASSRSRRQSRFTEHLHARGCRTDTQRGSEMDR